VETAVLLFWKVCAASAMLVRIDPNARSHSTFCYNTIRSVGALRGHRSLRAALKGPL
jgi:hypothetical protein